MRADTYQILLIGSGIAVAALFGTFLYRELTPEYRIYQQDYEALEEFRSTYSHEAPPLFKEGIKQIVLEREDKGPPTIDRCTSCHVALEIPYFSPTSPDYIWKKLDQKIAELRDPTVLSLLKSEGRNREANDRISQADYYESLKTAKVGDQVYDVTKVLSMHPLMGKETRPFEFHPINEYGCTSCHNGNGRGLTTDKAHGPVFDGCYEEEYEGPTPQFTEVDPKNDPGFSRVFNYKPGHELLFQTTPIFPGALIQAKCVQCHQTSGIQLEDSAAVSSKIQSEVDDLTKNYQRGRELYLAQACYACHRISGFARGGVGPELTKIGDSYPWYVKQSVVWPQADLRTSTMPNMRMDHQELEDIMTFLLAQKGGNKSLSDTEYRTLTQQWEAGKKLPWEEPVLPAEIYNLEDSMTVYATQGCASCHRLQGFDSNVELTGDHARFKQLFPEVIHQSYYDEQLPGSQIIATLDAHGKEISDMLTVHKDKKGLLEKIEENYPEVIESFYSDFRFASRAKEAYYREKIAQAKNPQEVESLEAEAKAWKDQVHNVLMAYIEVYGLGRLIGPHLNWSGVYRSDEWLMEHFHNPGAHTPRSLMPAFPFDDTKFYALTFMLDKLGIRNRDAVREHWNRDGFDPKEAFEMHCAQCHGISREGNGVIAEWIYPIPKNLRNPDFLRNLTKEEAILSIAHGVKGTPMPPWGEMAQDKPASLQKEISQSPVLTEREIHVLVDWLFSALPGGEVMRENRNVPKWQYEPTDVIKELHNESGRVAKAVNENEVFLTEENPNMPDGKGYYIKKQLYTEQDLEKGKEFFLLNCAVCHGAEAEGTGIRAQTMQEAKPRMLTNLDWINSRDDLRLLRSIKYGVPGTAMTPWGDFTSSMQRLQLVMFIRTLSQEHEQRDALGHALYKTFDIAFMTVEEGRIQNSVELIAAKQQLDQLKRNQKELEKSDQTAAVQAYHDVLNMEQTVKPLEEKDNQLKAIGVNLKKEKELYATLGAALITKGVDNAVLDQYNELILQNEGRYEIVENKLVYKQTPGSFEKMKALREEILKNLDEKILELQQQGERVSGYINSAERRKEVETIQGEIQAYKNLQHKFVKDTNEAFALAMENSQ